jgi:hypothetical protein
MPEIDPNLDLDNMYDLCSGNSTSSMNQAEVQEEVAVAANANLPTAEDIARFNVSGDYENLLDVQRRITSPTSPRVAPFTQQIQQPTTSSQPPLMRCICEEQPPSMQSNMNTNAPMTGNFPQNFPTQGTTMPGISSNIPMQGNMMPNIGSTMPTQDNIMPNIGGNIPMQGNMMPNIGSSIPMQGNIMPNIGGGIPTQGNMIPNIGTIPGASTTPQSEPQQLESIHDQISQINAGNQQSASTAPAPISQSSIQYLNGFMRTQIGRVVRVDFLVGTNTMVEKVGVLLAVGANYILINELETDDILACDYYNIKFIKFYY